MSTLNPPTPENNGKTAGHGLSLGVSQQPETKNHQRLQIPAKSRQHTPQSETLQP
jgi:hypothetical protein